MDTFLRAANNQIDVIERVVKSGAAWEYQGALESEEIGDTLEKMLPNYSTISSVASCLVDGRGIKEVVKQFNMGKNNGNYSSYGLH